ncbi:MAG: LLM class flavin-dependent oxidoreductase [Rubrivivax sp.]
MSYQLSLLDKSPIPEGADAVQALAHTVRLAQRAEQLGYRRFWVAEHHASPTLAGAAPEVLVAHLLARTERIRIGSGGVMLQHYSPYKVAEQFSVLAALAPGRVDLGVGKAPGGLPRSTRALQALHDRSQPADFDARLQELDAFLGGTLPPDHPLQGTEATPQPPLYPQRFLLGATPDSAALAVRLGWQFCYAGHFNGDAANVERTLQAYRLGSGRPASLALYAFAADTAAEAERRVAGIRVYKVHLANGQRVNLPSLEAAAEFARQAGGIAYTTEETRPQVIAGTAQQVRRQLDALAQRFGVDEFIVDSPVPAFEPRLRSVELLAQAVRQPETVAA